MRNGMSSRVYNNEFRSYKLFWSEQYFLDMLPSCFSIRVAVSYQEKFQSVSSNEILHNF